MPRAPLSPFVPKLARALRQYRGEQNGEKENISVQLFSYTMVGRKKKKLLSVAETRSAESKKVNISRNTIVKGD